MRSTVVLVLVGALCSVRHLSAAERHNVATMGLAAMAGVAATIWLTTDGGLPACPMPLPEQATHMIPGEVERPLRALAEAGTAATAAVQSLQHGQQVVAWGPWIFTAYAGVALALGASTVMGRRRVARYVRRLPRSRSATADALKQVDVRVDACATPWTWGVRRPVIVLPEDFEDWPQERQDAALAHELSHISRRDCLVDGLSRWVCNIFWFQPLVWTLWLRQRRYAEGACDDAVLTAGGDACDYADTLLTIAKSNLTAKPLGIAVGSKGLKARLQAVLRSDIRRDTMTRGKRRVVAALAFALIIPAGACSVVGHQNVDIGLTGTPEVSFVQELTPEEVATLERRLGDQPDDIHARTRLISHYAPRRYRGQAEETIHARRAHAQHLAWVVTHAPDAAVLDHAAHASVMKAISPAGYAKVKEAWRSQLDRQPRNTVILDRFARFIAIDEPEHSRELLHTAERIEPLNPKGAERLGASHLRETISSTWRADSPSAPLDALDTYDRAFALHGAEVSPLVLIGRAEAAFIAKRYALAKSYANALLAAFDQGWNAGDGDLVHQGHTILGRLALAHGDVRQAKEHLLGSGRTPGSPVLGSFGPRMSLALELLDKGEFEVVGAYLDLCSEFWDDDRLDAWRATVAAGETPDFGGNLY